MYPEPSPEDETRYQAKLIVNMVVVVFLVIGLLLVLQYFHFIFLKDEDSIIKACADMNVPIFSPSITDSMLGFQVWVYSQDHELKLNPQLDIKDIMDIVWQDKKFGALILGGGVPKHFIAGMMQASGKELDYAIQVTLDRPEHGGVSGAHLKEAKSWKKVAADALITDVICDVTLAFPLIVAGLLEE